METTKGYLAATYQFVSVIFGTLSVILGFIAAYAVINDRWDMAAVFFIGLVITGISDISRILWAIKLEVEK